MRQRRLLQNLQPSLLQNPQPSLLQNPVYTGHSLLVGKIKHGMVLLVRLWASMAVEMINNALPYLVVVTLMDSHRVHIPIPCPVLVMPPILDRLPFQITIYILAY
ncbi:MAG: hypothetical protein BWY80_00485 [Firmicutes bacterium ADurb.Bin456]|nr:MAG: hypothetical protein BWY80_00485 [Firmicutes bacterium ADurb.Bin456]